MPTQRRTRSTSRRAKAPKLRKLAADLRKFALAFPGAYEAYPWDERVVKGPNNRIFVFLGDPYMVNGMLHCTVKLPRSSREVLKLPFAKPCGYGLGKHGWVSVQLTADKKLPSAIIMKRWIEESYRSVVG